MKRYFVIIALLFSYGLHAQSPYEIYSLALQHLEQRDTAGYLQYTEQAHKIAPFDLWFTFNLARAYAMNGKKTKCIEILDDLSVIGFDFKIENDNGFAKVWNHSLVKEITARAKKNSSVLASTMAFTIPEKDLSAEGIAYDPRRNVFYLSSFNKRKIVAVLPDGSTFDFVADRNDSLLAPIGLRVDPARNQLWVLNIRQSGNPNIAEKAIVQQYDLGKKQVIQIYMPEDTLQHVFIDLTVVANGDVYITDSRGGSIYKIDAKNRTMRLWYQSNMILPSGITVSSDQQFLFVSHLLGINRISLTDMREDIVSMKAKTTLTGIDGLCFYNGCLIALQNDAGPQSRVMKFQLNGKYDTVTKAAILESDHPYHNVPATGVLVGGDFYYIANSQQQSLRPDGKMSAGDVHNPTYILKLPLTN
ncbi:MAG: hypothetical protein AB1728_02190 [Bacteroidota bacterium]